MRVNEREREKGTDSVVDLPEIFMCFYYDEFFSEYILNGCVTDSKLAQREYTMSKHRRTCFLTTKKILVLIAL